MGQILRYTARQLVSNHLTTDTLPVLQVQRPGDLGLEKMPSPVKEIAARVVGKKKNYLQIIMHLS